MTTKPTFEVLGIEAAAQAWRRSGAIEVAFAEALGERWVLLRVTEDPESRILVYNQHEWDCFLNGVRNGEFDDGLGGQG